MCDPATLLIGSTLIGTAGNFVGAAMTASAAQAENEYRQFQIFKTSNLRMTANLQS